MARSHGARKARIGMTAMRWFPRGNWTDDEWKRKLADYEAHLAQLYPSLPDTVRSLGRLNLHDGRIESHDLRKAGSCRLRVVHGDLQVGYTTTDLHYAGVHLTGASVSDIEKWLYDAQTEILDTEIDRADSGYQHGFLLGPVGEFALQFQNVSLAQEPADSHRYMAAQSPSAPLSDPN
jgi:hypothetical protein